VPKTINKQRDLFLYYLYSLRSKPRKKMQFCTKVVHGKSWRHRTRLVLHGGVRSHFPAPKVDAEILVPLCKKRLMSFNNFLSLWAIKCGLSWHCCPNWQNVAGGGIFVSFGNTNKRWVHACYLHLKIEFRSCATGRQWCGIIHYYWLTASIKPRLLFSCANYASWGLSLSSVQNYFEVKLPKQRSAQLCWNASIPQ